MCIGALLFIPISIYKLYIVISTDCIDEIFLNKFLPVISSIINVYAIYMSRGLRYTKMFNYVYI